MRIADAAKSGGDHVAMLESGGELRAFCRIVPQPVKELGEAPLGRIDAAAPIDHGKLFAMRCFGNFGGFRFCAVVAPEVVVVEWLKILVNRNDGRASRIERDRSNIIAADA